MKRAVIVEHRYLLRAGIEALLSELQGVHIAALFEGTEKDLLKRILLKNPDILIINPDSTGPGYVKLINEIGEKVTVFGLINEQTAPHTLSHFKYVIRQNDDKQTIQKTVRQGAKLNAPHKEKNSLSSREITVLKQIVKGFTNRQIADNLFLSIHTVTTHRKNIHRKLGINTVSGLTVYALMNGIVTLPETKKR